MANKDLELNSVRLKNRVEKLGIKQWWLAEQIKVDRKTVSRWLNGQVKTIQRENAQALADVLQCRPEDFCGGTSDRFATADDQRAAAALLLSSSLVSKLGPIGEWNVIESLVKSTIVDDLPLDVLGELYNQLTVALWRQSKMAAAEIYNNKAIEIAERCQDEKILAHALLSQALLQSWKGEVGASIATNLRILSMREWISDSVFASTESNLGAVYGEAGDFEQAMLHLSHALDLFLVVGRPTQISICYCHIALICLELNQLAQASAAVENSLLFARQDQYRRGVAMGELINADLAARAGMKELALETRDRAMKSFHDQGIHESLNFEFSARVSRLCGQLQSAQKSIEEGLRLSLEFPISKAALLIENARLLQSLKGSNAEVKASLKGAIAIYQICGCPKKIEQIERWLQFMG